MPFKYQECTYYLFAARHWVKCTAWLWRWLKCPTLFTYLCLLTYKCQMIISLTGLRVGRSVTFQNHGINFSLSRKFHTMHILVIKLLFDVSFFIYYAPSIYTLCRTFSNLCLEMTISIDSLSINQFKYAGIEVCHWFRFCWCTWQINFCTKTCNLVL